MDKETMNITRCKNEWMGEILIFLFLLFCSSAIFAQCPPLVNAGSDATITCGMNVQIGTTPQEPSGTMAPSCTTPDQLTQGGGVYINKVTTTGGITNINNPNTLINGIDPMGPNAWQSVWYSDYTNQIAQVNAGSTLYLNIYAVSINSNPPYSFRIWIDWNNDGTFNNVPYSSNNGGELVYTTALSNSLTFTNIPIAIPTNASPGVLRMRIRGKDDGPFVDSDEACTYNNPNGTVAPYGGYTGTSSGPYWFSSEIEDYGVQVSGASSSGGGYSYSWSPATGLDNPSSPTPTATPTTTTTYTITVTDTVHGCSASDEVVVTVNSNTPTPAVSTSAPTCTANGSSTITNYDANNTYTFTPPGPTISTNGDINNVTPGTTYTVSTEQNGCISSDTSFSIDAQLSALPDPIITTTSPTCSSAGVSTITNYDASLTYTFTPAGPTLASDGSIQNAQTSTSYSVIASNGYCQSNPVNFTNEAPLTSLEDPIVFTNAPTCTTDGRSKITNYNSSFTYTFSPAGPTIDDEDSTIQNAQLSTNYSVVASNGSCQSNPVAFINEPQLNSLPDPQFTVSPKTCTTNGSATITNYSAGMTYTFSPAGPTVGFNGMISNAQSNVTYSVAASDGVCPEVTGTFTINEQLSVVPSPTVSVTNGSCSNSGTATISNYDATYTYAISPNNLSVGTNGNISGFSYGVDYEITAQNGSCISEIDTFRVDSTATQIDVTANDDTICSGMTANITISSSNPSTTFTWEAANYDAVGGENGSGNSIQQVLFSPTDGIVTYTITPKIGDCQGEPIVATVTVNANPTAAFTTDPDTLTTYHTTVKFTNESQNATAYQWCFGDEAGMSTQANPNYTYDPEQADRDYKVVLIATNGQCTDTTQYTLKMIRDVVFFVPTAFTPDGDENNNVFIPVFADAYDEFDYHLTIFDRWGEIIFESSDTKMGWDGTLLSTGKVCQDGTYVWKITLKKRGAVDTYVRVGHVTLIK